MSYDFRLKLSHYT